MSSPLSFFRRNQKLLLAVFGVLIMLTFVVGDYIVRNQPGAGGAAPEETVVTWKHGKLDDRDLGAMREAHNLVVRFLDLLVQKTIEAKGQPKGLGVTAIGGRVIDPGIPRSYAEEDLVQTMILARKAEELGVRISDAAILEFLDTLSDDVIPRNQFGVLLRDATQGRFGQAQLFEQLRTELLAQHMRMMAGSGVFAMSPGLAWDAFNRLNRRVKTELLPLPIEDFKNKVTAQPTEEEIAALYEEGKSRYPSPDLPDPGFKRRRQIAFQYLKADFEKYLQQEMAAVTKEQVEEYYEKNKADFKVTEPPPAEEKKPAAEPAKTPDPAAKESPPKETAAKKAAAEEPAAKEPAAKEVELDLDAPAPKAPSAKEGQSKQSQHSTPRRRAETVFVSCNAAEAAKEEGAAEEAKPAAEQETPKEEAKTAAKQETAKEEAKPAVKEETPKEQAKPAAKQETAKEEAKPAAKEETPKEQAKPAAKQETAKEEAKPAAKEETPKEEAKPAAKQEMAKEEAKPAAKEETPKEEAKPAAPPEAKPSEPASAKSEEKKGETQEPTAKYKPLAEVEQEIRRNLARAPAQDKVTAALDSARTELRKYFQSHASWRARAKTEPNLPEPPPPDVKQLAEKHGLIGGETPLVDELQIGDYELGKAFRFSFAGNQFRRESFAEIAYNDRLPLYQPDQIRSFEVDVEFLYWKTKEAEPFVPALPDIRNEVVEAWKSKEAFQIAKAEAEKLAKAAKGDKPLKESLDATLAKNVQEPPEFTWLTRGAMPMGSGAPMLNVVEGVEHAGQDFMQAVFALRPGEVGVAVNTPQTVAYVVRLISESPPEEQRRTQFVEGGLTGDMGFLARVELQGFLNQWHRDLEKEMQVKWHRPPEVPQAIE